MRTSLDSKCRYHSECCFAIMPHEFVLVSKLHRYWRGKDSLKQRKPLWVPIAGIILGVVSLSCYMSLYLYADFIDIGGKAFPPTARTSLGPSAVISLNVVSLSRDMTLYWYPNFIDIGERHSLKHRGPLFVSKCRYHSEYCFVIMLHESVIVSKLHRYWRERIPSNNENQFGFQVQVSF